MSRSFLNERKLPLASESAVSFLSGRSVKLGQDCFFAAVSLYLCSCSFFGFFFLVFYKLSSQNVSQLFWHNMPTHYFFFFFYISSNVYLLLESTSSYQANVAPADFCSIPSQACVCVFLPCMSTKSFGHRLCFRVKMSDDLHTTWLINQQLELT